MADKKISQLTAATTPLDGTEVLPIVQSNYTVKVTNNDLRPKQIQSNATSGVLQVAGPSAAATRVMTTPDANFTVARTDAAQTFTGMQTVNAPVRTNSNAAGVAGGLYLQPHAVVDSRNWRVTNDVLAYGDFAIQQSTTQVGTTYTQPFYISPTGDVQASTGNFVVGTSGKGIDFSATAGTGTSELLADYEEGTWTPSVGGDATYTIQEGYYVKVGQFVFVQGKIQINVLGTGVNNYISGLPYTSFASSNASGGTGGTAYFSSLASSVSSLTPYTAASLTRIYFGSMGAPGTTSTGVTTVFQNGTRIDFSMVYRSAT